MKKYPKEANIPHFINLAIRKLYRPQMAKIKKLSAGFELYDIHKYRYVHIEWVDF